MKIALLTDGIYPYVLGGIQKHSYYLAKYLARNKVYVDLYHTGPGAAATDSLDGFSDQELAFITSYYIPFPSGAKFPGHYVVESYKYSALVYEQFIANAPVDFIYAQGFTALKFVGHKGNTKLPKVATNLHGLNMYQQSGSLKARLEAMMLRVVATYLLKRSDFAISLGGKLTAILEELGIHKKAVIEQSIGIEQSWLRNRAESINKSKRRFIFIGRYDKVKGLNLINEVLLDLDREDYEFHFIGPIPDEVKLNKVNLVYHGLIQKEAMINELVSQADILVCPSYSEGMPTVILEAMASKAAVIASDVGAVSELVNPETGWLIPAGDKTALQNALVKSLQISDAELALKKEKAQQLIRQNYTWEKVIEKTISQIGNITRNNH